ncbi:hypothetical protein V5O48_018841, partial [Marasmius crinis-equi]
LPIKLLPSFLKVSFVTKVYKALRDYQIMRGFDPATAEFARHCGLYKIVYQPVKSSLATTLSRFEELYIT